MKFRILTTLLAISATGLTALPSVAQSDYPNRTIRLLVGFAAGGSTDVLSRMLAQEARKALGQEVLIVNKAGAAGSVAINELITMPPDGYTIATTPSSVMTIAPYFLNVAPGQLEKTDALLMVGRQRAGVMTSADSPIRTFKDFVAQARANPGKLSIGYIGPGTMGQGNRVKESTRRRGWRDIRRPILRFCAGGGWNPCPGLCG